MATNDFVPFCPTDTGTNLLSQADYLASPDLSIGNQPGVASSKLNNKVLRQSSFVAACLAQFLANTTGQNVLDDGNQSNMIATMAAALTPIPAGTVHAFGGTAAPTGYLMCDGSTVSRTTYANLFSAVGIHFGNGDGSTTFNLPDLRGQFLRGTDNMGTVAGAAGVDPDAASRTALHTGGNTGNNVGSAQVDALHSHNHQYTAEGRHGSNGESSSTAFWADGDTSTSGTVTGTMTSTGGNETRPKNVYVNYIIKT